jgi:hypothetical protein
VDSGIRSFFPLGAQGSSGSTFGSQIWYNRHKCWMCRIDTGKEEPGDPAILKMAKAAARRVERQYGKQNLGPWDDFEWGMLNGKMSALNWVLGEQGDFLDT